MFNSNEFNIIPSIRKIKELEYSLKLKNEYILLSDVHIGNLKILVDMCHKANKKAMVNMDLIGGLALDKAGIGLIRKLFNVDIVIGSNVAKINMAKSMGMKVIHRVILMDSRSFDSALKSIENSKADAIEVIPSYYGLKFMDKIKAAKDVPLILGGFIDNTAIIKEAAEKGFSGITVSDKEIWNMNLKQNN